MCDPFFLFTDLGLWKQFWVNTSSSCCSKWKGTRGLGFLQWWRWKLYNSVQEQKGTWVHTCWAQCHWQNGWGEFRHQNFQLSFVLEIPYLTQDLLTLVSGCLIWCLSDLSFTMHLQVKGFEQIRGVHLEPQPFDVERDLTTPTYKLKRPQLLKYYQVKAYLKLCSSRKGPLCIYFHGHDHFSHSLTLVGSYSSKSKEKNCHLEREFFLQIASQCPTLWVVSCAFQKEIDSLYASMKKQWAFSS